MNTMRARLQAALSGLLTTILVASLCILAPSAWPGADTAFAYDAPPKDQGHSGPEGEEGPGDNPDDPDQEEEADPVQLKSGNFAMEVEDFAIPAYALPISISRAYNNLDTVNDGPFGRGWSASFVMSIREVTRYATAGAGSGPSVAVVIGTEIVLRDDRGARHVFTEQPDGTYTNARGRFGTMIKTGDGRFTWQREDGIQFYFASNRLDRIVDLNGNALTVAYDGSGRIARVTNPAGRWVDYAYNDASKIAQITDNIGRTVSYRYSDDNLLIGVTDARGFETVYGYDANGWMNAITAPDGNQVLSNTYDTQGRVSQQSAFGASYTFSYNAGYTRVRNARNFYSDHYFNDSGNAVRVRDRRGFNRYMSWSSDGNLLSVTDRRGNITRFTYDDDGNILTRTEPNGAVTTMTYGDHARTQSVSDALGRTTTMTYDANGNLATVTDPLGGVQSFTYDSAGRILTATDELGAVATYAYDAVGNLISFTDENGLTAAFTYDGVGRVLSRTNAAGETVQFTYNAHNRETSITDPLGQVTTLAYNPNDELVSVTDPLGNTATTTYDGFGRVIATQTPLGHVTTFGYDSQSNLISITDPEGRQTTRGYDGGNLLTSVTRADGSRIFYTHDGAGNVTQITDPRGNITRFTYDPDMDWRTATTYADGSTSSYAYDVVGRITSMTDRKGQVFGYTYDGKDRTTQVALPTDGTLAYAYDARDDMLSASGYEGTVAYAYDPGRRLAQEVAAWGDVMDYAYDAANRLTSVVRPERYTLGYSYDADGRIVQAAMPSGTASYVYDADDRLTSEVLPNGVTANYVYDADDRLISLTYTAPDGTTVLASYAYTYDDSGLILTMTEADGTVHAYGYDGMIRLTSETITPGDGSPARTTTWTYDPNGNRLTQDRDGTLVTYTYNEVDEMSGDSTGVAYSYDENGNLVTAITASATETYTYDDLDRLTGVSGGAAADLSYGYDAIGARVRRTVGTDETRQVRMGALLLEETNDAGAPQTRFDYGLGLSSVSGSAGTRFHMFDGLTNVRSLSDASGVVTDTYSFGPHGDELLHFGSTDNPYVWKGGVGYYTEGRSDLMHVGARYYDAGSSRFIQTDPLRQGNNPYRHAMANPLAFDDPTGEAVPLIAWCARGAAMGAAEDEAWHQGQKALGGKEERTWKDRAVSAGIGCITGGFGNRARRAGRAADAAADAARRADQARDACRGGVCRRGCSFEGRTLVVTDHGLVAIEEIDPVTMKVMARDDRTGEVGYQDVLDHYSNPYDVTVELEIRTVESGIGQTIISNAIHPFFAVPGPVERVTLMSAEGVDYLGDIVGGAWVDAADLRPGDRLLTSTGGWSEVVAIRILDLPLTAWNMTVNQSDTYFVTNAGAEDAVWVHNCNNPKDFVDQFPPSNGRKGRDTPMSQSDFENSLNNVPGATQTPLPNGGTRTDFPDGSFVNTYPNRSSVPGSGGWKYHPSGSKRPSDGGTFNP